MQGQQTSTMALFPTSQEATPFIWGLAALTALLLLCYTIYGAIWRLYFSPIAQIPGPRLAALTLWVEFYYDVVLCGRYTFKIAEYHEKYGPLSFHSHAFVLLNY